MAFRQYTRCVGIGAYIGPAAAQVIVAAALGAAPLVIAGLVAGVWNIAPLYLIPLLYAIIAYCRWWLYGRLICLEGDRCAVGLLIRTEKPTEKKFLDKFDTDFSLNLLLAPNLVGATEAQVEASVQGDLCAPHPDIVGAGLPSPGHMAIRPNSGDPPSAVLHAEFEGAGVYDLLIASLAALALAIAAVVCLLIPGVGWLISLIVALVAAAVVGVGVGVALGDTANPGDVNANLGELHQGEDVLAVLGTWVYDSAHDGWNELHPIKACQRAGTFDGDWQHLFDTLKGTPEVPVDMTPTVEMFVKHWCDALQIAADPTTAGLQAEPQHSWVVHPSIDGCRPPVEDGNVPIA